MLLKAVPINSGHNKGVSVGPLSTVDFQIQPASFSNCLHLNRYLSKVLRFSIIPVPFYFFLASFLSLPYRVVVYSHRSTMGVASSRILDTLSEGTSFDRDELDRLRKRFMKLDQDGLGTIDKQEFLSIPGIGSNPLALRLMDVFDEDGSGTIDFQEFVTGLSAFSGKSSKEDKLRFAFKIYDIDRDGFVGNGELFIVMKMMVGKNLKDEELQQIVDKTIMEADEDGDGKLSFEEFRNTVDSKLVVSVMTLNMF